MKKIIALLLACLIVVLTAGCSSSTVSSQSSKKNNNSYAPNTKLSISDKEKIAEQQALIKILDYMELMRSKFGDYDIDATRYKTGAITHSGDKFTVNGTLYLYDKYGSVKDTASAAICLFI